MAFAKTALVGTANIATGARIPSSKVSRRAASFQPRRVTVRADASDEVKVRYNDFSEFFVAHLG
jgi:hypothetical protein